MKKRIFALVAAAIMVVSSTLTAFADTKSDLIGQFKFDGDLKNEVTGEEGVPTAKGTFTATEKTFTFVDGVDGSAVYLSEANADGVADTTGVKLNVAPKSGQAYTISVWVKALGATFANPIIWMGDTTQPGGAESWVGIWNGFFSDYSKGPSLGSNTAGDPRVGAMPVSAEDGLTNYGAGLADNLATFDWMNVTITVDAGVGKLYYNGVLVGQTAEGSLLPDVIAESDAEVSVYLGANAWDSPFNGYVDNIYVYDRVLSTADIQELVKETNVNNVTLVEYDSIEDVTPAETTSNKPVKADKNKADYLVDAETIADETSASKDADSEEGGISSTVIIIGVAVVVVIVVVVVIAVVAAKKKSDDDDEE